MIMKKSILTVIDCVNLYYGIFAGIF